MAGVLHIEDDAVLRLLVRAALEDMGHIVHELPDGVGAEAAVARLKPDVLVTDLIMPNRDGIEVIRALRASHPSLPIVAVSGGNAMMSDSNLLDAARALGARMALPKPFQPSLICSAVAACVEIAGQEGEC